MYTTHDVNSHEDDYGADFSLDSELCFSESPDSASLEESDYTVPSYDDEDMTPDQVPMELDISVPPFSPIASPVPSSPTSVALPVPSSPAPVTSPVVTLPSQPQSATAGYKIVFDNIEKKNCTTQAHGS